MVKVNVSRPQFSLSIAISVALTPNLRKLNFSQISPRMSGSFEYVGPGYYLPTIVTITLRYSGLSTVIFRDRGNFTDRQYTIQFSFGHNRKSQIIRKKVFPDYRGFSVSDDWNGHQIWILQVKIHEFKSPWSQSKKISFVKVPNYMTFRIIYLEFSV